MRISLVLLNNHEILQAISTHFFLYFSLPFPRQIICPVERKHTSDGATVLNENKYTLSVI